MSTARTNTITSFGQRLTMALLDQLAQPNSQRDSAVGSAFRRFRRLVEALPLTTEEFSFARNWLVSAQALWLSGDCHAARYQVRLVAKKLGWA